MPIVPCFNPVTGASGGPGGGGGGGFAWRVITDFNSLTFSDPNSLITNYNVAAGLHSLDLATLAVANADYNFGTGTNFTGGRWTFPLTYADGSPVLAGDTFNFMSRVTDIAVGAARTWHVGVGVTQNPTSTVLTQMDALATTFGMTGVGTTVVGTWRRNVAGTSSIAGIVTAYGTSMFGGIPGKVKVGAMVVGHSAVAYTTSTGQDTNVLTAADNAQLHGIIAVGTLGTSTTTGGLLDFRLAYAVEKLS